MLKTVCWTNKIIQLLTGDEGNIWYVGPEDKMLPEAAASNINYRDYI